MFLIEWSSRINETYDRQGNPRMPTKTWQARFFATAKTEITLGTCRAGRQARLVRVLRNGGCCLSRNTTEIRCATAEADWHNPQRTAAAGHYGRMTT
jgi:hypothetical protein